LNLHLSVHHNIAFAVNDYAALSDATEYSFIGTMADRTGRRPAIFKTLRQNLLAGLRMAPSSAFSASLDQVGALALVCVSMIIVLSYPFGADRTMFAWSGVTSWAAIAFLLTVLILVISRIQNESAIPFATQLMASTPWFLLIAFILFRFWPGAAWPILTVLAFFMLLVVALRAFRSMKPVTIALLLGLAVTIWSFDWHRFIAPAVFYSFVPGNTDTYDDVDVEKVFRDQDVLIQTRLDTLLPQIPDQADIYFVGFAGNADEPVFHRDVSWVHQWFNENYGTANRSVLLSTNLETLQSEPLASRHNLQDVLAGIGQIIDPNEDSIFLYLASHGSQAGWLDTSLRPLPLRQLTAESLKQALDEAGIRWRIIVISACYSGSFIETLANDQSLIMTAASADKTSFGCDWESEMTWFADALFRQSLAQGMGLIEAFENARVYIAEREEEEGISASDPQLFIGDAMRLRLEGIETAVGLID